jgi:hypothetical protein
MNTVSNDRDGLVHMIVESIKQSNVWKWAEDQMRRQQAGRHDQGDDDLFDEPDLDEFAEDEDFDDEGHDLDEDFLDEEDELAEHEARIRHEEPIREGRRKYAATFNTPGRRAPKSHGYRGRLTETTPSDNLYGDSVGGSEQAQDQWTDMSGKVATDPDGTDHVHGQGVDDRQKGHPSGTTRDVYATQRAKQRMAEEMARRWVEREDCHTGRDEAGRFLGQDDYNQE